MPTLGLGEILLILFIALLVIGPKQLPETARQLGVFFHNLKRNADVLKDDMFGREGENPLDLGGTKQEKTGTVAAKSGTKEEQSGTKGDV